MEHENQPPHPRDRTESTLGNGTGTFGLPPPIKDRGVQEALQEQDSNTASQRLGTFLPNSPPSRSRTPGACRPLARQASSQKAQRSSESEEEKHTGATTQGLFVLRDGSALSDPNRRRSLTMPSHSCLPNQHRTPAGQPALPSHDISAPETFQRPAPRRQVSHEVQEREQSMREELDVLKEKLRGHEEKRQRELTSISFAVNRIFEQQKSQMKMQAQLLDRLENMDLEAVEEAKAKLARLQAGELSDSSRNTSVRSSIRGSVDLKKRQEDWMALQGEVSSCPKSSISGETGSQSYKALSARDEEGSSRLDGVAASQEDLENRPT